METRRFDPADYLDGEEAISAYLADARACGPSELADAQAVIARARAMAARRKGVEAPSQGVAEESAAGFDGGEPDR